MKDFVPSTSNRDSYFLNFSDGMPMFGSNDFDYYGDEALQHTKRQVKEITKKDNFSISKVPPIKAIGTDPIKYGVNNLRFKFPAFI